MKKIKQLAKISLFVLALSLGSCSSDEGGSSTGGGVAAEGTIKAKVDGKSLTTIKEGTLAVNTSGVLTVQGTSMSGEAITIVVYNFNGAGTYDIITGNDLGAVFAYTKVDLNNPNGTNNTWYAPLDETSGTSGSVTVTESTDEGVKGTFSFKGVNDLGTFKNVTNGAFNVKYTQLQ